MINMIAAGEVIERPASVVKELVENSIDAGAKRITVSIEDGGRKSISVCDDGLGMDAGDLARAFEPHSTSKIKTSSDLLGISTLGFRGEALASIAAVAQVKAVSRIRDSDQASCIEIDCGSKNEVSPCSGDYGTTVQVRDIFYKLPARRKFLRTANTEMGHITEQFTRIALANISLDLTLMHNGRELYRLAAEQSLRTRVNELFPMLSSGSFDNLIETENDERGIRVIALLGKPSISRTSNKFQYIFLNGRFIRDKFISHAIKEAYRGMLEPNRFGVVFLFVEMPYQDYDVNVHPTKTEVRFFNANLVHSEILGCLRERLLGANLQTQAKLPTRVGPTGGRQTRGPRGRDQQIADAMAEFFKRHRPASTQQRMEQAWDKTAGRSSAVRGQIAKPAPDNVAAQTQTHERRFLQIHDSFIVEQTDDGFVIIDQHALHERILYETMCRRVDESKLESQRLLIPESFEPTASQAETLQANSELMEKLGIEVVPFGPKSYAVQAFPTLLANVAPADFVQDMLDLLESRSSGPDAGNLLDEVLNMAACKAAIKAGQKLSDGEIEHLLADRERVESASHCPHGRPTTIWFSISDLEKQFKRT
ncbi:MAG: DNA mismatch repair endonuclease MutL [Phycisphaerales bacterium]|nr:MAG: DNA mismatch repair endonuclease MutL [Phycisphaerales bacterium]